MGTEHDRLLLDAYRGEVFGEAFFHTLAAQEHDAGRATKLRALEQIEARTADVLRKHAAAVNVDVGDDDESRAQGRELATVAGAAGWDSLVRGLHDALPQFLANFVRLRELASDPHDAALTTLVQHEQTINAFAELELAGHGDLSGAVLQRYLEE
jgi:ABC-type transporter Mla subunit MlaD